MLITIRQQKWGSRSLFLSYERLQLKLRVFLAGHIVAIVTYCATKLTVTYSPNDWAFFDTMILISTDNDHQTLSLGKYWTLFRATLNHGALQKLFMLTTTHAHSRDNITFFQININFSTFSILPNILHTCILNLWELLSKFKFLTFHFITNFCFIRRRQ